MAGSPGSHKTREPEHFFCVSGDTVSQCDRHLDSSEREGRAMWLEAYEGVEQIWGELGADHEEVLSDEGGGLRVKGGRCELVVEGRRLANRRVAEGPSTNPGPSEAGKVKGDGGSVGISA